MSSVRQILGREESERYFFLRNISSGGMGQVDLIVRRESGFSRLYAAKQLHAQYRNDTDFCAMFLDEARVAGLMHHPNVVSVLDFAEHETGPYLVMEYVDGISLKDVILQAPVPIEIVVELARQTALGLHAAHELRSPEGQPLSLVHRDVSPQNILVGYDGLVRVTDFGIAKMYGRANRTATGVLKGKMGYMSPEQLRFEALDRRSDLFSLGVVLYELLSGRRLYSNRDGSAPRRILHEPVPDIGMVRESLPASLVELLFELLAKHPSSRPDTAAIVAERLGRIHAELEEPLSLADYVDHTFAEHRALNASEVTRAMSALRTSRPIPWPQQPTAPERQQPRRWILPSLIIGVLAASLGAFVGSRSQSDVPATKPAPASSPAATSMPEPPGSPPQPVDLTPAVQVLGNRIEPNETNETASSNPTMEEPTPAEPRRTTRVRRPPRRPSPPDMSAPPMTASDEEVTAGASEDSSLMVRRHWGFQGGNKS